MRYLSAFDAKSFGYEQGTVFVTTNQGVASIRVGDPTVIIGGQRVTYNTAPINHRGRVYLPLSMFSDIAGADISYDQTAKRIRISGVPRAAFGPR